MEHAIRLQITVRHVEKYTDACFSVLNFPDLRYNATVVFISRDKF